VNSPASTAAPTPSPHATRTSSTAEGKALLDDVGEFGDGQLVVLSGGDPMKRPDLVDLVDYGTDQGLLMTLTPAGRTNSPPTPSTTWPTPACGGWR